MTFQITEHQHDFSDGTQSIYYRLHQPGRQMIEVWPEFGFNCRRWQVITDGQPNELLWHDTIEQMSQYPTRYGIPILFPFPNRLEKGRFAWNNKQYQLPINGPQQKHAIHGFACYHPWRVSDHSSDKHSACLTASFQGSVDTPQHRDHWPSDYLLQTTYQLTSNGIELRFKITNAGDEDLPFGIGFHPYFQCHMDHVHLALEPTSNHQWELHDFLPTGKLLSFTEQTQVLTDANSQPIADTTWDDLFHIDLPLDSATSFIANIHDKSNQISISMQAGPDFHDFVIFTPPHRQAISIEPYTCITNAINLHQTGNQTGLITLHPGDSWQSWIHWQCSRSYG